MELLLSAVIIFLTITNIIVWLRCRSIKQETLDLIPEIDRITTNLNNVSNDVIILKESVHGLADEVNEQIESTSILCNWLASLYKKEKPHIKPTTRSNRKRQVNKVIKKRFKADGN